MASIVKLPTGPVPLTDPVAAEKRVSGSPMTGLRPATEDDANGFYTGVWASDVGAWRVDYTEEELCVIVEGRVRLTADDGGAEEFGAGDAFVIPRGYRGVWETLEPVRKIYAIRT